MQQMTHYTRVLFNIFSLAMFYKFIIDLFESLSYLEYDVLPTDYDYSGQSSEGTGYKSIIKSILKLKII